MCHRPLAKLVSRLAPTLAVATVNRNPLYPEVQQHWDEDPLNFRGNVRARAAAGGQDLQKTVAKECKVLQPVSIYVVSWATLGIVKSHVCESN